MAEGPPYATLAEVQAWLATLAAGSEVQLSSSLFDAPLVNALFALLPDADPLTLAVTSVDATAATLAGTATVLGEAGTAATFAFTQPEAALLCQLTLALPASVEWSLLDGFHVVFTALTARLTPNEPLGVVGLSFAATVRTSTTPPLAVPVSLTVPSFDGDWTLAAGNVAVGGLTAEGLQALAGNADLLAIFPADLADLSRFSLTGFEMAFDPGANTCSFIALEIEYGARWRFFGDAFTVQDMVLGCEVLEPFGDAPVVQATLYAQMQIEGGPAFQVGGQFPDAAVFARLVPDTPLDVGRVFAFLHLPLPAGFPAVEITTLSFTLFAGSGAYNFQVVIGKPVPILGGVSLDGFSFDMGATYDPDTQAFTGYGALSARFAVGSTLLSLGGSYVQGGGVRLTGKALDLPIGDLLAAVAADFGVQDVPAPLGDLVLETLTATVDTGAGSFDFVCQGTTAVADVVVSFTPTLHLRCDPATKTFTGEFGGTLVLQLPPGEGGPRDLVFTVTFGRTATDNSITATWNDVGGELDFRDIAAVFGFALPTLPSALDLALTSAAFAYDFATGALAFGAASKSYGNAAFVSLPVDGRREYFFLLGTGRSFSLSDLPLLGDALARAEDVAVGPFSVVVASLSPVAAEVAAQVNAQITRLRGSYPMLPAGGVTGRVLVDAPIAFGAQRLPLAIPLGGPQPPLSTGPPRGGGVETTTTPDGTTWFTVQRSFGPLRIQRIGARYERQTLWFEIDASLGFGPLSLTLMGLGIGSPLDTFEPAFALEGLGVAYSQPPLAVSGALLDLSPPGGALLVFAGTVTVSTGKLTLEALAYYGNASGFPSLFVFVDAAYPLGGPPAFFVTGMAAGFGYNSAINLPPVEQVPSFPFLAAQPASTDPQPGIFGSSPGAESALRTLTDAAPPWVAPTAGSLWIAAGVTFTSFRLVQSQALLVVQMGEELAISLVGTSRAQFPQGGSRTYADLELNLEARLLPARGVFSVQAVLSPASFLLDPACVLTGGFAFFVWFGDNPHAGDFVLTVGGYHPAFTPPDHYPQVAPVGFSWNLDSSINLSGAAYFALTPSVLMAGGRLNVTYQAGNLRAWLNAHADAIVRWRPFWFDVQVGVTVGASYRLDLLFTTVTLSVELGCTLEVWGPPTGGVVTVDWYIISFSIPFGRPRSPEAVASSWADVQAMLPGTGTPEIPDVLSLSAVAGLAGTFEQDGVEWWLVRGSAFECATATPVPASLLTVGETARFTADPFHVHPLGWSGVTATHAVAVSDQSGGDVSAAFTATPSRPGLPASLWGSPPQAGGTPQVPPTDGQLVKDRLAGVTLQVNAPALGRACGPVDVARNLAFDDLGLGGALLPVSASAPTGTVPVNGLTTVSVIASPTEGIASPAAVRARADLYAALDRLGDAPGADGDLSRFAATLGGALAAQPLLVA